MAAQKKVPVTQRALVQRINRALAPEGERLCAARGTQALLDLGDFYTVDVSRNIVARKFVDLESLGRELGVLQPFETLESK